MTALRNRSRLSMASWWALAVSLTIGTFGALVALRLLTPPEPDAVRFATFNTSLNRDHQGELIEDLSTRDNVQARSIARIVQLTQPDVLLVNEFDFDNGKVAAHHFRLNYLEVSQDGAPPAIFPYVFVAPSNTGVASGHDLDNDGMQGGPGDSLGFGHFEGQFGMALFSKHPIDEPNVRTFQTFLWKDMPGAHLPGDPLDADGNGDMAQWFTPDELKIVRLSSKSHWDVPIRVSGRVIHALISHPTPPVFDGPEDRNGARNADEIRFWADYITPGAGNYIYDDKGASGGLAAGASFVILGDLNADPLDGDSYVGAARQLLDNPQINASATPTSQGGVAHGDPGHKGEPRYDTSDFGDSPGNLRIDYVLPSRNLSILRAEVFWPAPGDPNEPLVSASDHRLVFVDLTGVSPNPDPNTFSPRRSP